jgi:hypothetical protein
LDEDALRWSPWSNPSLSSSRKRCYRALLEAIWSSGTTTRLLSTGQNPLSTQLALRSHRFVQVKKLRNHQLIHQFLILESTVQMPKLQLSGLKSLPSQPAAGNNTSSRSTIKPRAPKS